MSGRDQSGRENHYSKYSSILKPLIKIMIFKKLSLLHYLLDLRVASFPPVGFRQTQKNKYDSKRKPQRAEEEGILYSFCRVQTSMERIHHARIQEDLLYWTSPIGMRTD